MKQELTNDLSVRSLLVSCAVGSILLLVGCPGPSDLVKPADDTALLNSFFLEQHSLAPIFARPAKEKKIPFALNVYVDHSASMRGYLDSVGKTAPKAKVATSKAAATEDSASGPRLFSLLRQLANQSELLRFHAFGKLESDTSSSPETVTPLDKQPPLNPRNYTRKNNDYASLIWHIKQQEPLANGLPVQHMIISDGVQSHHNRGEGSALSQTIASLKDWIDAGGVVEIRLINSTFFGRYYSEERRAFQQVNSSNDLHSFEGYAPARPFVVVSLLSGADVLPAWNSLWDRSGMQAVRVEKIALFPDLNSQHSKMTMKFNETVSKTLAPEMKFFNVWKNLAEVQTLDGYLNLYSAQVVQTRTKTNNSPETYPAVLHLKGEEGFNVIEEFKAAKPTLRVWRMKRSLPAQKTGSETAKDATPAKSSTAPTSSLPAQKTGTETVKDATSAKSSTAPTSPPPSPIEYKWLRLTDEELKGTPSDARRIFANKPPLFESLSPNEADVLLRLPLQPRGERADIIVLTLTPAQPTEIDIPDFNSYSCTDDSTPDSLDRIYNLQQWVEQFSEAVKPEVKEQGILVITHR